MQEGRLLCLDVVSAVGPLVFGIVSRLCLNKAPSESLRWWWASALVLWLLWWWVSSLWDMSDLLSLITVITEGVISLIADINCTLRGPDLILSSQLVFCQLMMKNYEDFCIKWVHSDSVDGSQVVPLFFLWILVLKTVFKGFTCNRFAPNYFLFFCVNDIN